MLHAREYFATKESLIDPGLNERDQFDRGFLCDILKYKERLNV